MKIGITGANGFVGIHLKNFLNLQNGVEIVPFDRSYFEDDQKMDDFVSSTDVIFHLAGLNRHSDPEVMFDTNVKLCVKLIDACVRSNAKPHIIFSSSTQEEEKTVYGDSKKEGRLLLEAWASKYETNVTTVIIPNVFGPFGRPFYNSVVATFCHQLVHDQLPEIHQDKSLNLVYINELVAQLFQLTQQPRLGRVEIPHQFTMKVSDVLALFKSYKDEYMDKGVFPDLSSPLHLAFFNTFRCYIPKEHYPVPFTLHTDDRGMFVEIARTNTSGQFSFSTTNRGITRGNHFHTRKAERFAVIKGKAKISLRRIDTNEVSDYYLDGNTPAYVDMPIWHTHNITNIGEDELVTLFWINEPYIADNPDTYFVNV